MQKIETVDLQEAVGHRIDWSHFRLQEFGGLESQDARFAERIRKIASNEALRISKQLRREYSFVTYNDDYNQWEKANSAKIADHIARCAADRLKYKSHAF